MLSPFTICTETTRKCFSDCPVSKPNKNIIQIINFRGHPTISKEYIELGLTRLKKEINIVIREEKPNVSFEELYRIVENLIQCDQRQHLFSGLKLVLRKYLSEKLEKFLLVESANSLCGGLISFRNHYCKKVVIIKNIYLRYDRSSTNYFKFNRIQTMCMKLFKDILLNNSVISNRLTIKLLTDLAVERQGEVINTEQIKTILEILIDLDVYVEVFESTFLIETESYFQKEGSIILNKEVDVRRYLKHVNRLIKEEESRSYLPKETLMEVLQIIYREMLEIYLKEILNDGFVELMDEDSVENLSLLFNLFIKVPEGVAFLNEHFEKYVDIRCSAFIEEGIKKNMIQDFLDLKDKLDTIVRKCFNDGKIFHDTIKNILTKKVNIKNNQFAQYLAKYLDGKLRSKYISEEELESILDKFMVIFRYIQGKDVFEAFYRKDLARRLIFDKSTNQDVERSIIVKLKEECGDTFTAKLEGMLRDINLSRTINSNFKEYLAQTQQNVIEKSDVSITILTSSYWNSTTSNLGIILPDELLNYQAIFRKYYVFNHSGRKLEWQPNLGHNIVRVTFGNTIKELQVSLFQTVVLLLFNLNDRLTSMEIQEMTKIETKELFGTLYSLSCGKIKVLLKEPQENIVTMDDVFQFNQNFSDKLFRIKINQAQFKDSIDEQIAIEKTVLVDRQFQIDAAIVRILKNRQNISHNELLAELFNILEIPVRPQDLKKRIELLIDREYIKRDSGNSAAYTYIA